MATVNSQRSIFILRLLNPLFLRASPAAHLFFDGAFKNKIALEFDWSAAYGFSNTGGAIRVAFLKYGRGNSGRLSVLRRGRC